MYSFSRTGKAASTTHAATPVHMLEVRPKATKCPRFEVSKLKSTETKDKYKVTIGGRFQPLLDIPDTDVGVDVFCLLDNDIGLSKLSQKKEKNQVIYCWMKFTELLDTSRQAKPQS